MPPKKIVLDLQNDAGLRKESKKIFEKLAKFHINYLIRLQKPEIAVDFPDELPIQLQYRERKSAPAATRRDLLKEDAEKFLKDVPVEGRRRTRFSGRYVFDPLQNVVLKKEPAKVKMESTSGDSQVPCSSTSNTNSKLKLKIKSIGSNPTIQANNAPPTSSSESSSSSSSSSDDSSSDDDSSSSDSETTAEVNRSLLPTRRQPLKVIPAAPPVQLPVPVAVPIKQEKESTSSSNEVKESLPKPQVVQQSQISEVKTEKAEPTLVLIQPILVRQVKRARSFSSSSEDEPKRPKLGKSQKPGPKWTKLNIARPKVGNHFEGPNSPSKLLSSNPQPTSSMKPVNGITTKPSQPVRHKNPPERKPAPKEIQKITENIQKKLPSKNYKIPPVIEPPQVRQKPFTSIHSSLN